MSKLLLAFVGMLVLSGCAQSGYQKFYYPYVDAKTLPNVQLISENQEPQIINSDNFDRDFSILLSKKYEPIGYSSFNGGYENIRDAAEQAKRVGASVVLVSSKYTNTETISSTLLLPDNKTTYNSGSIYENTLYNSTYGGYLGNSTTTGNYSGTSTTYGTKSVPITSHQRRYDQKAVYFVKSTKKYKLGLLFSDLTPTQRTEYERNTGVLINVVIEDSPAFYSNFLVGDLIISINNTMVRNKDQAMLLMKNLSDSKKNLVFKIIRNGQEKDIQVQL